MKTQIILLAALCIINSARAQSFSGVSLQTARNSQVVAFTINHEVNVRHYRVEASNDGVNYKVIGTIPSKGNSVMPINYKFDVSAYAYTHYKVGMVEMNGQMPYSTVVTNNGDKMETPTEGISKESEAVLVNK